MNVEKIIRVLGYIVYTALWAPFIVFAIVVMPIAYAAIWARVGQSIADGLREFKELLINNIQHDMEFIRTGEW